MTNRHDFPVVFLDFNGVLDRRAAGAEQPDLMAAGWEDGKAFDPACIEHLTRIVYTMAADVVISSSWRQHFSLEELQHSLVRHGFLGRVIGVTPRLHRTPDGKAQGRGDEILAWIAENNFTGQFVILDDDADMGRLNHRLVQTNPTTGLTSADVERAISMLGGGESWVSTDGERGRALAGEILARGILDLDQRLRDATGKADAAKSKSELAKILVFDGPGPDAALLWEEAPLRVAQTSTSCTPGADDGVDAIFKVEVRALDRDDLLGLFSEARKVLKAGTRSADLQFCSGAVRCELRMSDDSPAEYDAHLDRLAKAAEDALLGPAPAAETTLGAKLDNLEQLREAASKVECGTGGSIKPILAYEKALDDLVKSIQYTSPRAPTDAEIDRLAVVMVNVLRHVAPGSHPLEDLRWGERLGIWQQHVRSFLDGYPVNPPEEPHMATARVAVREAARAMGLAVAEMKF